MSDQLTSRKFLVVDHSNVVKKIIKKLLIEIGVSEENILTAHDGNQAYLMMDLAPLDLVICGVFLEVRNGDELLKLARSQNNEKLKQLPFLFVSTIEKETLDKSLEGESSYWYLKKPFNAEKLKLMIETILFV